MRTGAANGVVNMQLRKLPECQKTWQEARVDDISKPICYLRQAGYVIIVCAKTSERICIKFSGKVGNRPMNN